jgi:hypothetical protein
MAEAETESEAIGVLLGYIGQLESAILIASEELRPGRDPEYSGRILILMANRIRASMDAAEATNAAATWVISPPFTG